MALFAIAAVLVESAPGEAGRARSLSPSPATAAAFDAGRRQRVPDLPGDAWRGAGAFLAAKRVSVQFSRTYWQTNEFRSSRNTPCASHGTFLEEYGASNGTSLTHSVVFTTEF